MIWTRVGAWWIVTWVAAGCAEGDRTIADSTASARPEPDAAAQIERPAPRESGVFSIVEGVPVERPPGTAGKPFEVSRRTAEPQTGHARRFGSVTLSTALRDRSGALTQYPCSACHFGRKVIITEKRIQDAHQDVKPSHPELSGATCSTCHAPEDVSLLALQGRQRATLDQSHQLCNQCHSKQVESWRGGAHGKRLDGWQGRRVVMACPGCHDPHSPGVQPRIPFRAPQIERTRGNDP